MEQERFKMPTGALIACILITVFLLACVAGVVLFVTDRINNVGRNNGGEAYASEQPVVTEVPSLEPTQQPAANYTAEPSTEPTAVPTQAPANGGTQADPGTPITDILANCMNTVVSIDISASNGYE